MNSLIITLCILMIAETEILLATPQRIRESPHPSAGLTSYKAIGYPSASFDPPSFPPRPPAMYQTSPIYPPPPIVGNQRSIKPAQEVGHLNNVSTYQEVLEVRVSYSYIDNEGNTFQVSYIANEDGFQPKDAHLSAILPLIKKALQYIAEHYEGNWKE